VTLVGQGLTLPLVTRLLRIGGDGAAGRVEVHARTVAAEAAVARIEELAREWPGHLPLIDTLRSKYAHRATHLDEAVWPTMARMTPPVIRTPSRNWSSTAWYVAE
jgi:hypothetical protein